MSMNELNGWAEYLSQEPANSTEIQLALLTTVVSNMMGGKNKLKDMLITQYSIESDEVKFASEDAVAAAFMALAVQA